MKKHLSIIALLVVTLIGIRLVTADTSGSGTITGGPITGWLWSSSIGWISLNCSNTSDCPTNGYGVTVNPTTGAMTGHAWSSSIGWIKFGGLSGAPTSPAATAGDATINLTTGAVTGWARACSATVNKDCNSATIEGETSLSVNLNSIPTNITLNNQSGLYESSKIRVTNQYTSSVTIAAGSKLYIRAPYRTSPNVAPQVTSYSTGATGIETQGPNAGLPYITIASTETLAPGQSFDITKTIGWYVPTRDQNEIVSKYSAELLGVTAYTGGWDGWISLSGTSYPSPGVGNDNAGTTLNLTNGSLRGKAWGSNLIGWLDFNATCAGCVSTPVVNNVTVTCSIDDPQGSRAPGSRTFTATGSGGNGTYQYSWGGGSYGSANQMTINYSTTSDGPIVQARSNGLTSPAYQCPQAVVTTPATPLKLFVGRSAAELESLNESSSGHQALTVTLGERFFLRWVSNLGESYTCTSSAVLPNGSNDSGSVWSSWSAVLGASFRETAASPISNPTSNVTPTGTHRFSISCTNGSNTESSTVQVQVNSSVIIEV